MFRILTFATILSLLCSCDPINTHKLIINLHDKELVLSCDETEGNISFSSSEDWKISLKDPGAEWLTIMPESGVAGEVSLTVHSSVNEDYDDRSATVIIKTDNAIEFINVLQERKGALIIGGNHYEVPKEGGTIDVEVKSNIDFEVKSLDRWIHKVETKGLEAHHLQFVIDANDSYDSREGRIVIENINSALGDTVYICQEASFVDASRSIYVGADGSVIKSIRLKTEEYDISISDPWITYDDEGSNDRKNPWFVVSKNFGKERTAKIIFSDRNSSLSDTIAVKQSAGSISDREILIALYNATNGDNWTENTNWCSDKPVNEWYGIGVDEMTGKINSISLSWNNLTGYLPEEIGGLTDLIDFSIGANDISGNLPSGISSAMSAGRTRFNISGNRFTGKIPSSVLGHPNWKLHWPDIIAQTGDGFDLSDVGIPAPEFKVTDIDGQTISSETEYKKNKYTILYRWATGCPFSHAYTVELIHLYNAYEPRGLEIIGYCDVTPTIYQDDDIDSMKDYIAKQDIPWRNFGWNQDTENVIWPLWYASFTPFLAIVDQDGRIVFQNITEDKNDLADFLSEHLGEADIEKPVPYTSTDFSADGQVVTLQKATVGNGIDLVFMGDAFVDTTMVAGGIYEQRMREGMEAFFMEEPMKSLRNRFNVHVVKVVSENGDYIEGANTALECFMGDGTQVGGSDSKCFEYARKVSGIDLTKSQVIAIMNVRHYAGTCYMYYDNSSVAYFPLGYDENIFGQLLNHEAVGHGFGKLLDEYSDQLGDITDYGREEYLSQKERGWGANTDITSDPERIRWAHFLKDSRYAHEVGIHEGALTFQSGAWRPTENSIMRYNTGGFNAPSREALYRRVMELSGEGYSWDKFVSYDAINRKRTAHKPLGHGRQAQPLHPPVIVRGSWSDAR